MIDFLMLWNRDGSGDIKASEVRVREEVARLRLTPTDMFRAWYSRDGQVAVLIWGSRVPPILPIHRVHRDDDGIRFFIGWMMNQVDGPPASHVDDIVLDPGAQAFGEFAALRADVDEVTIWRNAVSSVPLYFSQEADRFVASTRASIACYGRTLSTRFELDPDFARSVLTASISLNDASLFKGVSSLRVGARIYRPPGGRPVVHQPSHAPLYDAEMQRSYRRDRKLYWDDVYDELIGLMAGLDLGDLPLVVPLSGGKDSRLLMGLLTASKRVPRIESILTLGIPGSPEIQSATAITESLGLSALHDVRSGDGSTPLARRRDKFLEHTFVTEGEMSPLDLPGKMPVENTLHLHGQEAALRNIAGKRHFETSSELLRWFRVHLARWDVCDILTDQARRDNEDEFLEYFGKQLQVVDDINQLPTKHRGEHRTRRWMARKWQVHNSSAYAPFVLAADPPLRATYNAGARSRSLEEFHFEMMWRSDPRLVEIPFADQTWDPALEELTSRPVPSAKPFTWASELPILNRRPIALALQASLDDLRSLVATRRPPVLEGVLDLAKLGQFDAATMKPGHVQPLLHLMNLLSASAVTSFADLDAIADGIGSFEVPDFDR